MIEQSELASLQLAQPPWRMDWGGIRGTEAPAFRENAASQIAVQRAEDSLTPQTIQQSQQLPGADLLRPTVSGDGGGLGSLDDIIIVFNGTAYYCTLAGMVTGPV